MQINLHIHIMKNYKKISLLMALIMVLTSFASFADDNEGNQTETVYGLLNSDGSVSELIVTEHIEKNAELQTVVVNNNLENVKLLMNDVDYDIQENEITFTTDESDIYFRGNSLEALPVTTTITFYINDVEVDSSELLGQTGHLRIEIKQINNEKRTVTINDESRTVYLPFETALAFNMDNQIFENVTSTSGKIIDDGDIKVLTAILTPGFKENFDDIESDYLTDMITIEADVTELEIASIYMTTVCRLPEIDINSLKDEISNLDTKIDEFSEAGNDLENGAIDLNSGIKTYFGKQTEAFSNFEYYLANDAKLLNSIVSFNNGFVEFSTALEMYTSGVTELLTGVNSLSQSSPALVEGMTMLQGTLTQVLPASDQTTALLTSVGQLQGGIAQLDQGIQALNQGGSQLALNTEALLNASNELKAGSAALTSAANQLLPGNQQLDSGLTQLSTASNQVINGSQTLTNGVSTFKLEGIDTLVEEVESSISRIDDFEAMYDIILEEVEAYNCFTGENSNLNSSTIFILKTESIK